MSACLVIFIDSLPYTALGSAPFVRSLAHVGRQEPGFGFSINNYAELFAGLTPDRVGFFNEWTYKRGGSEFWKYRHFLRSLAVLRHSYYADWISHRLLGKKLGFLGFVPYDYLPWLGREGTPVFSRAFPFPSVLDTPGLRRVVHTDLGSYPYDELATRLGLVALAEGEKVFITLVDLDVHTHIYGVHSPEHTAKVQAIDAAVRHLCEVFWQRHPGAPVCVLSDHGMVNVEKTVGVDLEARFGRAGPKNHYYYFLDMTMLRVWFENDRLESTCREYLSTLPGGRLLSTEERTNYGITRLEFGDLIYVLEPGTIFFPSFWTRKKLPRAMHGYLPGAEDLYGVVASTVFLPRTGRYLRPAETFHFLCNLFSYRPVDHRS